MELRGANSGQCTHEETECMEDSMNRTLAGNYFLDVNRAKTVKVSGRRYVRCLDGLLWVTEDGELLDIFLKPGECHEFRPGARLAIFALQPSRYLLSEPLPEPQGTGSW